MGVPNITIVITSVAFCGGLSGIFKPKVFSVDELPGRAGPDLWPVAVPWDSLTR
jgi:hypothetical protein